MKPSDISEKHPWSSVFQNTETEVIARNIAKILKRTGDKFRKLPWEEYKQERMKDGAEEGYFKKAYPFLMSADAARTFSTAWDI